MGKNFGSDKIHVECGELYITRNEANIKYQTKIFPLALDSTKGFKSNKNKYIVGKMFVVGINHIIIYPEKLSIQFALLKTLSIFDTNLCHKKFYDIDRV